MDVTKEWLIAVGFITAALVLGLSTGAWGWSFFAVTVGWIGVHLPGYFKVLRWTERPLQRPENSLDSWFRLAYRPYRSLRRQRQRTQQVTAQMRQLLHQAQNIPDGFIALNANGEIESVNRAAADLLQLNERDRGIILSTIVRSPDFVGFLREELHDAPLEFSSPIDGTITLEARIFDTAAGGSIVLVRDITALNRLLTVRQEFVANVSHELRTPLAVVQGYLETLLDSGEDTELRLGLLPRLDQPMRRMQSLVDDLLLLTRLESREEQGQQAPLDLADLLQESVRELDLQDATHQIQLDIEGSTVVLGSEPELRSVFSNLLSNAIRYSPDGGAIEVKLWSDSQRIHFSVTDAGVGIAPEHLNRLTERFYRVDMADARTRGGTGLGLAIVKHVLRRHDSSLEITSTLGQGSTFLCAFDHYQPNKNTSENSKEDI